MAAGIRPAETPAARSGNPEKACRSREAGVAGKNRRTGRWKVPRIQVFTRQLRAPRPIPSNAERPGRTAIADTAAGDRARRFSHVRGNSRPGLPFADRQLRTGGAGNRRQGGPLPRPDEAGYKEISMPLPDRIDTALMRPQLMFDTAAMMVPATACASGACRRHRRCLLWDETLGRPSCLSLLSGEEQAAYPARLADAERALRIILADWPPSPSPDPDIRERQDAAIAIAARVIRLAPGFDLTSGPGCDGARPARPGSSMVGTCRTTAASRASSRSGGSSPTGRSDPARPARHAPRARRVARSAWADMADGRTGKRGERRYSAACASAALAAAATASSS